MRKTIVGGRTLLFLTLIACGARKPPQDASTTAAEKTETKNDGTNDVKWEGASAEDMQAKPAGTPADSTPAASLPAAPEPRRTDSYDREQTDVVLKRAARQVKEHCGLATDENGKASGPWGKISVQVSLGHNGHSKGVTVPAPFDGKPTGRCAAQAFKNLTFPPWAGADAAIEWEVEIPPPGK